MRTPYTGILPAGTLVEPAIALAESENADKLVRAITHHVERLHLDATSSASHHAGAPAAEHKR